MSTPISVEPPDEEFPDELRAILDEELARLPARHRDPLVLCELEGLSRPEAAQRLGIPQGTLSSRLARGKDRLRIRLVSRGVSLTTAAISAILIREARAVTMPLFLLESTVRAATLVAAGPTAAAAISAPVASLSEGVLQAMFIAKLKGIVLAVGTMTAIVSGAIVLAQERGPGGSGTGSFPTKGESRNPEDGRRGELPRRPAYANSSAQDDRTAALEKKLDLILEALGRNDPGGTVKTMTRQAPPWDYDRFAKRQAPVPDNPAFQPGPDVKMPPANMRPSTRRWDAEKGDSQDPRTVFDRLQVLEQQMQEVQQRLERMEGQLKSLDRRVGGARSSVHDLQKGQPAEKKS